jgi:hypothetical protein
MAEGVKSLEKNPQLLRKSAPFGGGGQEKFGAILRKGVDRGHRGLITMEGAKLLRDGHAIFWLDSDHQADVS